MVLGHAKDMANFLISPSARCGQTNCVGPEILTESPGKHAILLLDGPAGSWSGLIGAQKITFCCARRRMHASASAPRGSVQRCFSSPSRPIVRGALEIAVRARQAKTLFL